MTMRRLTFPALLAVILLASATPSFANHILTATGTVSCTNYSLVLNFGDLDPGVSYTATYTFTLHPSSGPDVTINGSTTFTGNPTDSMGDQTVDVSGVLGPLTGSYTIASGTATLAYQNTVNIAFGSSTVACSTALGRFTGGGKQVIAGYLTITKGFEVDCDLNHPNNLEINWADGAGEHHFHMESFLSAVCTLQGNPTPPVAPVNTIVGIGTGRFDGNLGYTVEFTLQDNGEPGRNDAAGFKVCVTNSSGNCDTAPAGQVVLAFPANYPVTLANLTDGNIQAHVDQH
jgi:hypothetical protein